MLVLGIESSCDDTAIAIIDAEKREILANLLNSQIEIHRPYGGVVPEIAARSHVEIIEKLILQALKVAGLKIEDIALIAATGGPGLIGGVITSVMVAKGIALSHNIPLCFVNHLEGHSLMSRFENESLEYPFLVFLASGGHLQLLLCEGAGKYEKLGGTIDDSIGESFDKVAKMLDLSYPGGPIIEKKAQLGDEDKYNFPVALVGKKHDEQHKCNFSLSGLKTSVRTAIAKFNGNPTEQEISDIAASFQKAVAKQIENKIENALIKFIEKFPKQKRKIVFSGGVAANKYLNNKINKICAKYDFSLLAPEISLCTDNGVMIAWAGYENYMIGNLSDLSFKPKARWGLEN